MSFDVIFVESEKLGIYLHYEFIFSGNVWRSCLSEIDRIEDHPVVARYKNNTKFMLAWNECLSPLRNQKPASLIKQEIKLEVGEDVLQRIVTKERVTRHAKRTSENTINQTTIAATNSIKNVQRGACENLNEIVKIKLESVASDLIVAKHVTRRAVREMIDASNKRIKIEALDANEPIITNRITRRTARGMPNLPEPRKITLSNQIITQRIIRRKSRPVPEHNKNSKIKAAGDARESIVVRRNTRNAARELENPTRSENIPSSNRTATINVAIHSQRNAVSLPIASLSVIQGSVRIKTKMIKSPKRKNNAHVFTFKLKSID